MNAMQTLAANIKAHREVARTLAEYRAAAITLGDDDMVEGFDKRLFHFDMHLMAMESQMADLIDEANAEALEGPRNVPAECCCLCGRVLIAEAVDATGRAHWHCAEWEVEDLAGHDEATYWAVKFG